MSDLLHILPSFPTKPFSHIIPSLERNQVTVNDLLTRDALEIAEHSKLPIIDVRRLANQIIALLQKQLGLEVAPNLADGLDEQAFQGVEELRKNGVDLLDQCKFISTLDEDLDRIFGGGIPTGYLTEVTGERYRSSLRLLPFLF